jgi:predicted alpha/beta-hydrolase family hydrolase
MGGRVASMLADHDERVEGVVCLGYPFHPPGKPEQLRTVHLETMETPTLICQGERDPFGGPDEVAEYPLSPAVTVRWFADGDHGLKPRKGITGLTELDHLTTAADAIAEFTASVRP